MAHARRKKVTAHIEPELLDALDKLANSEGKNIQSLIEDALNEFVEKKSAFHDLAFIYEPAKDHVISAYQASHEVYAELYEKLAQ